MDGECGSEDGESSRSLNYGLWISREMERMMDKGMLLENSWVCACPQLDFNTLLSLGPGPFSYPWFLNRDVHAFCWLHRATLLHVSFTSEVWAVGLMLRLRFHNHCQMEKELLNHLQPTPSSPFPCWALRKEGELAWLAAKAAFLWDRLPSSPKAA